jgi:hypothetical protein
MAPDFRSSATVGRFAMMSAACCAGGSSLTPRSSWMERVVVRRSASSMGNSVSTVMITSPWVSA